MAPLEQLLPMLLGSAVLLPLASFALILLAGPRLGPAGKYAGYAATAAIVGALILSLWALGAWVRVHPPGGGAASHRDHHAAAEAMHHGGKLLLAAAKAPAKAGGGEGGPVYSGDWYALAQFGRLRLSVGYYIDSLTLCMFCLVTLIASCIHVYSLGYMHDELHEVTDREAPTRDGRPCIRPGRFSRFFQYLSLFCFSMLGLVVSGNVLMTFAFWELVGICSFFLIGFYIERPSACRAANKAFIVNRVGDFGMIVGLMALWAGLGTFHFADYSVAGPGGETIVAEGIFRQVRPPAGFGEDRGDFALRTPDGLVRLDARHEIGQLVLAAPPEASRQEIEAQIAAQIPAWRDGEQPGSNRGYGYWLLVVAGLGIFCGCVGKSAQFPLHVWLPDAMEGPTPVSALVHSATMVAAGVFLVGRFFPVFAPEVLLAIASIGAVTLLLAASIAITATDIKRVLAYSTVSQLGYMMLALGLGGWLAGMMHLVTHAFFKSLLFLGSGSVIHAVHTNEMPQMGGLLKKMPWTAGTMLIGCLAIAGFGIPFLWGGIGLSGFYSKDAILEQAYSFMGREGPNALWGSLLFYTAACGAAITAFYMFRLWYMTFLGRPRDRRRYEHAHESPWVMVGPLAVLAFFAVSVAWSVPGLNLTNLLEQARPAGTSADQYGVWLAGMVWPDEHAAHVPEIMVPVTLIALGAALAGFGLATAMYALGYLNPEEAKSQLQPVYRLLINKWWFDELYELLFVRPVHRVAAWLAAFDRRGIDGAIDGLARLVRRAAQWGDARIDRGVVDAAADRLAQYTYRVGLALRAVQTGRLRQYVMFLVVGAVAMFILVALVWL